MKIAVLSDIHGNWPALEATAAHIDTWRPDYVIVNGDIVNRGPKSLACWEFVKNKQEQAGWLITRGNHEDYVTQYLQSPDEIDDFNQISYWTFQQVGAAVAAELAALPIEVTLAHPQGGEVRAVHASLLGTRYGIWHHSPDEEARRQIAPAPAIFCTGHVHFPFIRPLDNTLIVNAGSAGSVCDLGDTRATYAQITWRNGRWSAEIVRVAYDMEQAARDYEEQNMFEGAGPVMKLIYKEWLTGWPVLPLWGRLPNGYQQVEHVGLAEAIEQFVAKFTIDETVKRLAADFYQLDDTPGRLLAAHLEPARVPNQHIH